MNQNRARSILVVDDNPEVVKGILRLLRREPYELVSTTDPREALELLAARAFDLLLSDVDMPFLSGHEVTRRAREISPHTVRVLVTGTGTLDAAVRAINEGEVHRFVRKPFEADELREVVAEALARKAELDLVAEADQRARRRRLLFGELEVEHPGITTVERDENGAYVVDTERARDAAHRLGLGPFLQPKP